MNFFLIDDQNTKSKKSSKHNLRHGHDVNSNVFRFAFANNVFIFILQRMEIIDNEEGQMIQKKKKPSL